MIAARTDVVGSLLRPGELLEARTRLERGKIGPPEFKRVEDAAVAAAIRLQEDAGLAVVTDGEMRRLSFQSQLTDAVEGFSDWDLSTTASSDSIPVSRSASISAAATNKAACWSRAATIGSRSACSPPYLILSDPRCVSSNLGRVLTFVDPEKVNGNMLPRTEDCGSASARCSRQRR